MILTDPELFNQWQDDVITMSHRIIKMRDVLYEWLNDKLKTPAPAERKDWGHIKSQIVGIRLFSCQPKVSWADLFESNFTGHVLFHGSQPETNQKDRRGVSYLHDSEWSSLDGWIDHKECRILCEVSG